MLLCCYYAAITICRDISYHSFSHSEALICAISITVSYIHYFPFFYIPTSPNINSFIDEFSLFLPTITSITIILGGYNIPNPPMIQSLNKYRTTFNLVQHITSPTHIHGNTLDLIITSKTNKSSLIIPSDHSTPTTSSYSLHLVTPNPPKHPLS